MLLVQAVKMYSSQGWDVIATYVPGCTVMACKDQWYRTHQNEHILMASTGCKDNDDMLLVQAVEMYSDQGWDVIATYVPGHTMMACKDWWYRTHQNEPILTASTGWMDNDDMLLMQAVEMYSDQG